MRWSGVGVFGVAGFLALMGLGCTPSAQEQQAEEQGAIALAFAPEYAEVTAAYQRDVAEIQERGREALAAGDQEAVLAVYRSLAAANGAAAEAMEAIAAPDAVRDQHAALVRNLRQQRDRLDDVVAAATSQRDTELTEGLKALAGLLADFATLHRAIDQELAQGP